MKEEQRTQKIIFFIIKFQMVRMFRFTSFAFGSDWVSKSLHSSITQNLYFTIFRFSDQRVRERECITVFQLGLAPLLDFIFLSVFVFRSIFATRYGGPWTYNAFALKRNMWWCRVRRPTDDSFTFTSLTLAHDKDITISNFALFALNLYRKHLTFAGRRRSLARSRRFRIEFISRCHDFAVMWRWWHGISSVEFHRHHPPGAQNLFGAILICYLRRRLRQRLLGTIDDFRRYFSDSTSMANLCTACEVPRIFSFLPGESVYCWPVCDAIPDWHWLRRVQFSYRPHWFCVTMALGCCYCCCLLYLMSPTFSYLELSSFDKRLSACGLIPLSSQLVCVDVRTEWLNCFLDSMMEFTVHGAGSVFLIRFSF